MYSYRFPILKKFPALFILNALSDPTSIKPIKFSRYSRFFPLPDNLNTKESFFNKIFGANFR